MSRPLYRNTVLAIPLDTAPLPAAVESTPRFSLVVPCYNEEQGIEGTIKGLRECLRDAGPYELVIVDDGSADGTQRVLEAAQEEDLTLRVIRHTHNRGYGAALKTGIRNSSSELVVILDADGTYPHHRIPELLEAAEQADMVVGARTADDVEYPLVRKVPKLFLQAYAVWIAGQEIPDLNSGMRVLKRSVVERFLNVLPDGFSFTTTITLALLTNHYSVRYIPIGYSRRLGKSKIKPVQDTLRFFQLILRTGIYFAPLRIFSPFLVLMFAAFVTSLAYDVLILRDLRETTLLLMILFLNTGMFALLADMIDKRSS